MNIKSKTTSKTTDVYGCGRCKITSETKDRCCPCPRGGCEAKIIGKRIETVEIVINPKKKPKKNTNKKYTLKQEDDYFYEEFS